MKFKAIVEYEYPIEHKPPVKAEIVLHGDRVIADNIKTIEQQPCEDYISREEALKQSRVEYNEDGEGYGVIYIEDIEDLPPVTPQPKVGRWIFDEILDKHYYCSECKSMGVNYWDYCPTCGAKMEVEK